MQRTERFLKLQMQEHDYATPTKRKRKTGGFKYSTKKVLARSRMGKRLSRVDEGEAFLTSRTILFKPGDEDTYTDVLGSTPYIGGDTNSERITDTQEYSSEAEDAGEDLNEDEEGGDGIEDGVRGHLIEEGGGSMDIDRGGNSTAAQKLHVRRSNLNISNEF